MPNVTPDMRLKVKRDTFFLPDSNNSVYFRNNINSFRMEGAGIDKWIEKILPMMNGEYTLGDLTEGLPGPYRDRVYEIAQWLYRNGYVRDVSQDRPHRLMDQVLKEYASQIEFLDNLGGSGGYRFQTYRQSKVLAIGSGPFLVSLVSSLIQSGLPKFQLLITNTVPTNRERLKELAAHAGKTDTEVEVKVTTLQKEGISGWREVIQPFDFILYVSQEGDLEELRVLHTVCREEKKTFLPAICQQRVGLAGPLVRPDSKGCWESLWRRVHQSVFSDRQQVGGFSATAGAMLANVIVFELFKEVTRIAEPEQNNQFYLLDLDTIEGNWHSFFPHPLVAGRLSAEWIKDLDLRLERNPGKDEPNELLVYFSQLTSETSGIFHIWDEGDLKQLPLAQCRVQAADMLSEGPADLLPEIVCTGLTHEEARREAGLAGIEAYVSQGADLLVPTLPPYHEQEDNAAEIREFVGVGAGATFVEGVCRGLQRCLDEVLCKHQFNGRITFDRVQLGRVEDERCRFYLEALTTMQGPPIIGLGEHMNGFPLVWVGTNNSWYGSVDLNITLALRKALQQVLMKAQNKGASLTASTLEVSSVLIDEKVLLHIDIPACEQNTLPEILRSAVQILKRNHKRVLIFDLASEPFLKEGLAGVFGVLLREEGSR